jgi:hypothetical protein
MARPTKFNQALADEIAERLSDGETLKSICEDEQMPHRTTVFRWEAADLEFCNLLARARAAGAHALIDDSREIVDDGRNDWMEKRGRDSASAGKSTGRPSAPSYGLSSVGRRRRPSKVYGLRQMVEHSGSIGLGNATDEELLASILELVATGRVQLPHGVQLAEDDASEDDADDFSDIA